MSMITLLLGFVGLVLIPALILSRVLNRLVKEPAECVVHDDNCRFTISLDKPKSASTARRRSLR